MNWKVRHEGSPSAVEVPTAQQVLDRSRVAGAPLDVQDALGELVHQIARFGPEVFVGVLRHALSRHSLGSQSLRRQSLRRHVRLDDPQQILR